MIMMINVLFGSNLVVSKLGMATVPPLLFTSLRFAVVAVALSWALRVRRDQMAAVAIVAVTMGAIHFTLFYLGLALADDVSTVAIAVQLVAPLATVLSVVFLGESVGWRRWTGIALAFAGIMILGFDPRVILYLDALLLVIAGALSAAIGILFLKRLRGVGVFEQQAWLAWISAPILFVLSLIYEADHVQIVASMDMILWSAVLYSAFGTSVIAHGSLYYLLQRYEVSLIMPMSLLSTVFAIVMSVWLLNDLLTTRMILGGIVTLSGVAVVARRGRPSDPVPAPADGSVTP